MKEKITTLAIISVGLLSFVILFWGFIKYLVPVILPFLIAWLVASVTVRPAKKLSQSIKASPGVIRLIMSLMTVIIFVGLTALVLWRTTAALWSFLVSISEENRLYDLLAQVASGDMPLVGSVLPPELASRISDTLSGLISGALTAIAEGITGFAGGVPRLMLFLLVTLISLVYFSLDYDKISSFVLDHLPRGLSDLFIRLRGGLIFAVKKYVISYSLILLITYATLLIGMLLLGLPHAAVIAFFIALADILPIIGVGTVLLPWSVYELAVGNSLLGVGLIILFLVCTLVRQFSEPKIVGKNLDLHPTVTLMLLYSGYALFGLWGMLVLPVLDVCVGVVLKDKKSTEIA
jgi:sporulation integral membrane protein YtvI